MVFRWKVNLLTIPQILDRVHDPNAPTNVPENILPKNLPCGIDHDDKYRIRRFLAGTFFWTKFSWGQSNRWKANLNAAKYLLYESRLFLTVIHGIMHTANKEAVLVKSSKKRGISIVWQYLGPHCGQLEGLLIAKSEVQILAPSLAAGKSPGPHTIHPWKMG